MLFMTPHDPLACLALPHLLLQMLMLSLMLHMLRSWTRSVMAAT